MGFLGEMFSEERDPAPPPNGVDIASTINAQRAMHDEELGLAREMFAWSRDQSDRQLQQTGRLTDQQVRLADANEARASDQWREHTDTWRPIEREYARRIQEFDTPERRERNASEAAADVTRAFDANKANQRRTAMSYGIDPNSGRFAEMDRVNDVERAKATSGASNSARRNTELQGIAMMQGGAQFGRGLPSTGIAADQLALAGATQGANTGIASTQAATNTRNAALPWYGAAGGTLNQAGQVGVGYYSPWARSYGDTLNYNMASKGIVNEWVGNIANMVGGAMGMSSKDYKHKRKRIDKDKALRGIQALEQDEYEYKPGMGDRRKHVGSMAEDIKSELGESAAPGGKLVDFLSLHGIEMAGIGRLADRLDEVEEAVGIARGRKRAPVTVEG